MSNANASTELLAEQWLRGIQQEMDAMQYDEADFATPETVGRLDAELGLPCNPTEYYIKLGQIESYIIGFKDATAEMERRAKRIFTVEEMDERNSDYADWLMDANWIARGC